MHTNSTRKYYYDNLTNNNNNNYVNLHNVTNLGLCNKYILVTQKQVLELHITAIECKTLYSLCIPHTAFPNATRLQQPQLHSIPQCNQIATTATKTTIKQQQNNKGPCYQDRNRDLAYNLVEKCQTTGFYPTIKENW